MIQKEEVNKEIQKLSQELNKPKATIDLAYAFFWKFIKDSIGKLPLKEDLTEEEFNKLKTSFNIPSIGKLYCTWDKYQGLKRKFEYLNKIRNGKLENKISK